MSDSAVGNKAGRILRICIINPKFNPSIWSNDYAIDLYGGPVRCNNLTGCLATLAGLADPRHQIRIIDENVEEIAYDELRGYDVIGVTGMIVQRWHMYRILEAVRGLGAQIVVGGPLVTCDEPAFENRCDAVFIGEAETTWPAYLEDIAAGRPTLKRYVQTARSDMTKIPKPRLDLIKSERYRVASIQFSRGCPFQCEFCDIIVTFGRVPRMKTAAQVIAELQDVVDAGFRNCFLVDDNFIGNKREARKLLEAIAEWQKTLPRPLLLATEASINLADAPDLLDLMRAASLNRVFVGIETPNLASLKETRKTQNLKGDSLVAKVRRIRDAGLTLTSGFIVGFDEDTPEIFEAQYQFIHDSAIALPSIGILAPLPTTPLYDRLAAEGRLYPEDPACAFEPKQMTREQLKAGHRALIERVFDPDAFFERAFRAQREQRRADTSRYQSRGTVVGARAAIGQARIWARLMRAIAGKGYWSLIPAYRRAQHANRALGDRALPPAEFLALCLAHWHIYCMSRGPQDSIYLEPGPPAQHAA
ncbi:B12-binding domain-containing radical SAM protein [Rhodobacter maris]|uniref:Radical SAM superfamily enzyme YgiQ (UPF0313 family) n=1 Tax=Rhodobacter maris TaxID=446682 RepID=A0A285T2S6_9RHOB|nr:radical SAM protein [Rhodobacter maris]SOC15237.1 radical SAM superfamily enzyme YgiQ (UPF0313 family) [Rhodobacter maris]